MMANKKRRCLIQLAACLTAGLFLFSGMGTVYAKSPEKRTLKVAFPELEGISETDQYGRRKGLLVDYLNEIAKYTGWEYEYISVDNEEVVSNFMEGQYDLMGGTFYSSGFEKYFSYPDYSTGRSRAVLLCRRDDESLKGYDLSSLNGKTIGVYEKAADKIRHLEEFLSSNDLDCPIKFYSYEDMVETGNLYRQLREGEVDMLLGNDLEIGGEFRMVASFQAQPYYIVTTVGNEEVLNGLNTSLRYILESTPNFAEEVYNANFPDVKMTDIQLNDEEQSYVAKKKNVTVAVPENWHPIYCQNNTFDHHEGMLPALLSEISDFTGLQFTYVYASSYAESIRMVQNGEADIMGGYMGGEEQAVFDGLALSRPYISLGNIVLKHKSVGYPADGLVCGILDGQMLPVGYEAEEIRNYDTVSEMLEAVNTGEVDYVYGASAMLEQEMQNHRYLNVMPVTQASDNMDASFAIAKPAVPELLTILNKAVSNIPTEKKASMLNQNMVSMGYMNLSLKEMIYANPIAFLLIFGCILLLGASGIIFMTKSRMKNSLMQSRLEAAEAKSRAKSEFLSQMSHEIRTPMNAVLGLTDLASMEEDIPPKVKEKLKKIRSSSQYLLSLINDILDMARIENRKMEIEQSNFSLSVLLDELKTMLEVQAQGKGLEFRSMCRIGHEWLTGDPVRLRQVLTNLLANAIKFTPVGGTVTLQVEETSCQGQKAEYHFSVQDTGVGIAGKDQERIFAAFEQLISNTSGSAGTGLGLAISRNIVKMMGGDIQVKSEPGKGSRFFMTLSFPLGVEEVAETEAETRKTLSLEGMHVLLAEDNDLNAEIAQELLETQGVRVSRAADGQQAVDLFIASRPGEFKAVLMDIRMPVKDGHEAAREIRASGRPDAGVPIIAITANTFQEDVEEAGKAGMNDFIPKPMEPERLFSVLQGYSANESTRVSE